MQDLIKQSESEEKISNLMKEWFTTHYDFDDRTELVKEILNWHTKQIELAYNKGREESSSCNTLCTNRKDTYHEWNMRNNKECYCKSNTNII